MPKSRVSSIHKTLTPHRRHRTLNPALLQSNDTRKRCSEPISPTTHTQHMSLSQQCEQQQYIYIEAATSIVLSIAEVAITLKVKTFHSASLFLPLFCQGTRPHSLPPPSSLKTPLLFERDELLLFLQQLLLFQRLLCLRVIKKCTSLRRREQSIVHQASSKSRKESRSA